MVAIRHLIMTVGMLVLWNDIWRVMIITILTHIQTITPITTCILIPTFRSLFRLTIRTTSIIMIILIIATISDGSLIIDTIVDGILIKVNFVKGILIETLIMGHEIKRRREVLNRKGLIKKFCKSLTTPLYPLTIVSIYIFQNVSFASAVSEKNT